MPIASVVISTAPEGELRRRALAALLAEPRVELGDAQGDYLPAVLDTGTAEEGEELVSELLRTVGILRVDVVSIDFEDAPLSAVPAHAAEGGA